MTPTQVRVPETDAAPFPAAVATGGDETFFWMSGATAIPLYHHHPHVDEECVLPDDIREQTRRVLATFDEVLEFNGLGWRDVVKVAQFLTDLRDHDIVQEAVTAHLAQHGAAPSTVVVGINALSAPGARLELEVVAVRPMEEES
ncbi:RidA family protein [Microbacterium sp.]|jgi:2-iminobutanoate/2-iminopropanoate deaminase|uniref:RidA family protein n=1 Tax=Microbacterium sp. TaxID=51671 RepID=UPI002D784F14|nr:RidA family protein [Microbacterium sp.]HET6300928.1 RidA family protein [Microbacterium sp.]